MLFTLEALHAKHGDSLLLHYGKPKSPKLIVIDGGPAGVYKETLSKRLNEIKDSRSPDEALSIRMLMISHLDDDHINGVLAFLNALVKNQEDGEELPFDIVTLWHNSFDDILGNHSEEMVKALSAVAKTVSTGGAISASVPLSQPGAAIVASVTQGRDVRNNAKVLALTVNDPFGGLVAAPAKGKKTVPIGDGLKFTVLGPVSNRVEELQIEWDAVIKKKGLATDKDGQSIAAAYLDESVFNLSSIVVRELVQGAGSSVSTQRKRKGADPGGSAPIRAHRALAVARIPLRWAAAPIPVAMVSLYRAIRWRTWCNFGVAAGLRHSPREHISPVRQGIRHQHGWGRPQ